MNVTEKISEQIQHISDERTFGYDELNISKAEYTAAAKALERLIKKGVIKKISKGVFYKPRMTVFGELKPSDAEILRPYLFENQKRIAYVTGTYLYNRLGLTTQLAFQIQIASLSKRIYINTGAVKATPVKSYAEVTDENYELLGFLDAMKDLKSIPDGDTKSIIGVFCEIIKKLNEEKTQELIRYALRYPPRVRALLGAILEQLNRTKGIEKLRESLNPLSNFKMNIKAANLKTTPNWNIQ